jgi:hypothetical protein
VFQPRKTARFFAVMLIAGGIIGVATVAVLGLQPAAHSLLRAVPLLALTAVFGWAAYTGVGLWQGAAYGVKWAPIIFASQIPILTVPGVTYQWFTGANFGPLLRLAGGSTRMVFSMNFGASGRFLVGTSAFEIVIGINLFAVVALLLLVRSNKVTNYAPSAPDAAGPRRL